MILFSFLFLLSNLPLLSAAEIVVLKSSSLKPYDDAVEGFKRTCKCTAIEMNLSEMDRQDVAKNILRARPAAVFAVGSDALDSVLNISELPVFYTLAIPLGPEISSTKNNFSGVSMDIRPEEYLSTIARLFPGARRIGLIYNKQNTGQLVKEALAASRQGHFNLIALENSKPERIPKLIQSLKGKIDAFWILPDFSVITPEAINAILLFSFQYNVPVVSFTKQHVKMGAVASLSVKPFDLGAQAGEIAAKKLNGSFPKVPALSYPQKVTLSVNKRIASKLGIQLNDAAVRNAEEVY